MCLTSLLSTGKLTQPHGDIYEGEYFNDKKNGHGNSLVVLILKASCVQRFMDCTRHQKSNVVKLPQMIDRHVPRHVEESQWDDV